MAFFLYATVWPWLLPLGAGIRLRMAAVNASVMAALLAMSKSRAPMAAVIRDWAPGALILLAYNEMGWLATPRKDYAFENRWVQLDRRLLEDGGWKDAIESLGFWLPGFLEFCYLMVYPMIPIAMGVVYARGRQAHMEKLTLPMLTACLGTYALFPFFPSDTPRRVFAGEMFPAYETAFRRLNWWLCESQGIHTSVFPSGHVSCAIACAFGLRRAVPEARGTFIAFFILAAGIFVATIYGRYHYAVDSIAGAAAAILVLALTGLLPASDSQPPSRGSGESSRSR
jgi:membrane-associated phospholipid phosphatase